VEEFAFSTGDLARTRFAVCPMWEVGTSFRLLRSGRAHAVHQPWIEQVRPRIAAAGLDRGTLAELIPPAGYVPDFLNPVPAGPAPTLAEELAAIADTPAARIERDLDRLGRQNWRRDQLNRLVDEITAYWELALAPYWARISAVLDADVFHRARQVAEHGTGFVLNDLHASLSWDDTALRLNRRLEAPPSAISGAGLLLIPSAFTGPGLLALLSTPPQLAYPARGLGTLWEPRPAVTALTGVLGRSRTRLLTELDAPACTAELAARTGITRPGVSQHLTALRDAGLVTAHRAGRTVLYARTAVAESLLTGAIS
jgi:DNA-binding transcriptional ArsR family regulator